MRTRSSRSAAGSFGVRVATSTIVSYGIVVGKALKAAEELAAEGIDAEVIDLRTVFPLDLELIEELGSPHRSPRRRDRGAAVRQRRLGDRGVDPGSRLRLPRRADRPRDRSARAGSSQPAADRGADSAGRGHRGRRAPVARAVAGIRALATRESRHGDRPDDRPRRAADTGAGEVRGGRVSDRPHARGSGSSSTT